MCAHLVACGRQCCFQRRFCKRSSRPTLRYARCWRSNESDGGRSGRRSKGQHEKRGGLWRRKPPRRRHDSSCLVLERPPPAGFSRWTGPLIATELGNVHEQHVWRFLRSQKIDLDGRKSWCESNDPEFTAKAADVVGLYVAPPENAIVLCVDEKPSIQALERAQGYLKLPNGRTLTGHSHDYKRNGTPTLFAASQG